MGNKEEKTFTDLFSSSKVEPEKTTKTFSDILNSSSIDEQSTNTEVNDETISTVTFDSIFDTIESKEDNTNGKELESNISKPQEEIKEEKNEEIFNLNSIFDVKEETNQEEYAEEQSNLDLINTNPFFEESNNSDSNLKVKEEQIEQKDNKNPFFSNNNQSGDIAEKTNLEENIQIESQAQEIKFNSNPFLNNEEPNTEAKEEIQINANPFFEETKKPEENPFFEPNAKNNDNLVETKPQNNTILTSEKKESITSEESKPKSTSPFFEEEKKSEENPLFQNQLSLIENKTPTPASTNIDTTNTKHYNVKVVKKKEPLIKFILGVLSYALFIWLLLIGITLLIYVLDIKIRAAKGDYSSPTFNAYVVLTGSMLPEIQVYDVVVTKKVEASELQEGDVITFASADSRFLGTIITHRIIKKNPPTENEGYTFQTRGDNNNVADSALVPENNIYGKVILKIPKLGYLQEFLASDGGWIIVILIPCLTVISYDTVKLIKGLKRKKYKNIKVQK